MNRLICVALLIAAIGTPVRSAEVSPTGFTPAAVAAALNECGAGDTLVLQAGTYELDNSLRLRSGIKLVGAGQEKTLLTYTGDKADPFIYLNECDDVEVAHLTLDGRARKLGQTGIIAENSRRLYLHHLTIRNLIKGSGEFVHGILFTGHNPTMERGVVDSRIEDCLFENIGVGAEYGGGIRMAWGSNRNRVERNVVKTTGRGGIFGDHSSDLVIRHNQVSGSGGEGLGLEIWGGCPRSLIEDNVVDHWLSVDRGECTAVRRNSVGTDDGSIKGIGIEIIARDVIVTDNVVKRGALIGLSVSNIPEKNNVFWGYNSVSDCLEWGAQFQGETGGIAHHYLYRCDFQRTVHGDPRAPYADASGHGFRINGMTRQMVFEDCTFGNNDGFGLQTCGDGVDELSFLRCTFVGNREGLAVGFGPAHRVAFADCTARHNGNDAYPPTTKLTTPTPVAEFAVPDKLIAGEPIRFACQSKPGTGKIVERLWDFNHGIAETEPNPTHTFDTLGKYRVTLIVWDEAGRGARAEKTIEVVGRSDAKTRTQRVFAH